MIDKTLIEVCESCGTETHRTPDDRAPHHMASFYAERGMTRVTCPLCGWTALRKTRARAAQPPDIGSDVPGGGAV